MPNEALKMARLKKACRRAKIDFDELVEQCRTGEAQFFDTDEASAVGTIMTSGPYKVYYVMVVGGTLSGWRALLPKIEEFAREMGCQSVLGTCRPGTAKPHAEDGQGYKPIATLYEKVL